MKTLMRNKILCFLYMMMLVIALPSCSRQDNKANRDKGDAENIYKISTAVVTGRPLQRTVTATGTLAPWEEVVVSNEIPGMIKEIFADLGDKVKKGEIILKLDQHDAMANLNSAEAALETNISALERARAVWIDASSNLRRFTELFAEGVVSVSQRDAIQMQHDVADAQLKQEEAQVAQARAHYELAKKQLSDTEIRAPISGEVRKRLVSGGELLKDKTPLFILVKNDPLKFQGAVSEPAAPSIKAGQEAVIYIDALPAEKFAARVIRVSPSVDVQTRTLAIEARVPNSGRMLKSGFFARAVILTEKEDDVPFVPESAVYALAGIEKVYVIENGVSRERLIKTGARESGMVEVVEGVKHGEVVAISGLDQLFDGAKIEIKE